MRWLRGKTKSRYGVQSIVHLDGTKLDSAAELKRYQDLLLLERANVIRDLEVHPRIPIVIGETPVLLRSERYPNGRRLTYVADFRYFDTERDATVVEDVKMASGHRTEVYRIKKALVEAMGITIEEIT